MFVRWGVAFVGVVGCDLFVLCLLWVLILFAWVGFAVFAVFYVACLICVGLCLF